MAKKGKGKDKDAVADAGTEVRRVLTLAEHPKATRQIRTVRAWAALLGFTAVLYLCVSAGRPLEVTLGRALLAGVASYVAAWMTMVVAWRQLAQAEIEHARKRIVTALLEMEAAERGGSATG
jgi:hypothetical protein